MVMLFAHELTGVNRVITNPVPRKPNAHAGLTGLTGLTGYAAHVRECIADALYACIKMKFLSTRELYLVNPVNPVNSYINSGSQPNRVALVPSTTRLTKVFAMKPKNLRAEMPTVAAFIDALRDTFGKEAIDAQIKKGMQGQPTFYASENGYTVGTPMPRRNAVGWHPVTGCSIDLENNPKHEKESGNDA